MDALVLTDKYKGVGFGAQLTGYTRKMLLLLFLFDTKSHLII